MAGSKKIVPVLNDRERFPAIGDLSWIQYLRQHPRAPLYNFKSGDRLKGEEIKELQLYKGQLKSRSNPSGFIQDFYCQVIGDTPVYRDYPPDFFKAPSLTREDLRRAPWDFVRDSAPLDNILCYATSGTTGAPLDVIFDPLCASSWLPQVELMLERDGIFLDRGPGKTAIALICSQLETLTYASASSYLDGAGFIKINLEPCQWKDPLDPGEYLRELNPSVLTGDPLAFTALMESSIPLRPRAMISSAMTLSSRLAQKLEEHFHCPLYDVYSMTECRNIAFSRLGVMEKMRSDLYLEVLHPHEDRALAEGEWGELTVSGGNNPYLPLIRYRTGDFCRLREEDGTMFLEDFQGRSPVRFSLPGGGWINTVDFSRALAPLGLPVYQIQQKKDFSLLIRCPDSWTGDKEVLSSIQAVLRSHGAPEVPILTGKPLSLTRGNKVITFLTERTESL